MNPKSFSLTPFPGEELQANLKIEGTIGRFGNTVSIGFVLRGDVSDLVIPSPAERPERRDRLWEETCMELFLGVKGSERYWEFNLSPAGHWNVYRFVSYRKERREEPAFASLPFRVRTEPESLRLSLDFGLVKIIPAGNTIEAAIGAVIRTVAGRTNHWALVHPVPRPDFHRREGFMLHFPRECP